MTASDGQPHKLAPIANGPFFVAAIDPNTVAVQRLYKFVENVFCNCTAKTTKPRRDPVSKPLCAFYDQSRIFEIPVRLHSCTISLHGSSLKEKRTSGTPANFDNSSTPLHDVEYCHATDRAK